MERRGRRKTKKNKREGRRRIRAGRKQLRTLGYSLCFLVENNERNKHGVEEEW